ncbi:large ribosomal subunit protein uL10c-like [Wolffia australiana]
MEASLCTFPPSKPLPLRSQSQVMALSFTRLPDPSRRSHPSLLRNPSLPSIRAAISRTKKESTVESVKQQLENCYLVAGIKYKGLTVKQLQELRKILPDSVKLLVAKNTLVGKAIEGTQWEALKPCMKGMNAWMFVHTEEIPEALKPYRSFQKEKKLEDNDFTGAVFEGKFYAPADFKALETMPSRAEVYAKLLGSLQSPGIALVSTLQAPARDLLLILTAHVKNLEEGGAASQE